MENSQTTTPAAPAAPTTPAPAVAPEPAPAATPPAVDPTPAVTPAPRTQDPVDHSLPTPAADPTVPTVPETPTTEPEAPTTDPVTPDVAAIAGELPEPDENTKAIQDKVEAGEELPSGVNPDGTLDPLVYAYENMPDIVVQGKEGLKGEVKTYTVKTAEDLPADFRFASQVEQATFSAKLNQNMDIARDLIGDANKYNEGVISENEHRTTLVAQKTELDQLIQSGKLPAITAKPTDENFMQDPGAIRAQQVLDHMKEVNADYEKRGIAQKITSVEVALQLLEAKEAIEARDARMGTISTTRNDINSKISGGGSGVPAGTGNVNQQFVHRDINSAVAAGKKRLGL